MRGFTLIEIIMVIGILSIISSMTVFFGYSLFRTKDLHYKAEAIVSELQHARTQALTSYHDSDSTVHTSLNPSITFQKFLGNTTDTTLHISNGLSQRSISIAHDGSISY